VAEKRRKPSLGAEAGPPGRLFRAQAYPSGRHIIFEFYFFENTLDFNGFVL
jgi:hypothetical protein